MIIYKLNKKLFRMLGISEMKHVKNSVSSLKKDTIILSLHVRAKAKIQ